MAPLARSLASALPSRFKFEENIGQNPPLPRSDYYRAQQMANMLRAQLAGQLPGPTPGFDFQARVSRPAELGYSNRWDTPGGGMATGTTTLAPDVLHDLANPGRWNPLARPAAVLVHEWAHGAQSPQLMRSGNQPLIEGSAQAFTQAATPPAVRALGYPTGPRDILPAYPKWTAQTSAPKFRPWVTRGQFGR